MNKQIFENLIKIYENAECIYKEGRIICHAKISNIQLDNRMMAATVKVIPTPGFFPNHLFSSWDIASIWNIFSFDVECWSTSSVGIKWLVLFNPILIEEVTELAKLEAETNDINRSELLNKYITEYQMQHLRKRHLHFPYSAPKSKTDRLILPVNMSENLINLKQQLFEEQEHQSLLRVIAEDLTVRKSLGAYVITGIKDGYLYQDAIIQIAKGKIQVCRWYEAVETFKVRNIQGTIDWCKMIKRISSSGYKPDYNLPSRERSVTIYVTTQETGTWTIVDSGSDHLFVHRILLVMSKIIKRGFSD